jgi:hypothetical protein
MQVIIQIGLLGFCLLILLAGFYPVWQLWRDRRRGRSVRSRRH